MRNQSTAIDSDEWISGREAARRLGIRRYQSIKRVAEESGIRRLAIPGRYERYHAADVEAIRAGSVLGGPVKPPAERVHAASE